VQGARLAIDITVLICDSFRRSISNSSEKKRIGDKHDGSNIAYLLQCILYFSFTINLKFILCD